MHENGVHAEAEAMGCGVLYQPEIAPHVEHPVVASIDDIDRLRVPDPETTFPLSEVLEATRILAREIGGKVFINGRADQGPIARRWPCAGRSGSCSGPPSPSIDRTCSACSRSPAA